MKKALLIAFILTSHLLFAQDSTLRAEFTVLFETRYFFINEGPHENRRAEYNARMKFDSAAVDYYLRLAAVSPKDDYGNIIFAKTNTCIFLNRVAICLLQLDTNFIGSVSLLAESEKYSHYFFPAGVTYENYFLTEFDRYKIDGDARNEFLGYLLYLIDKDSQTYKVYLNKVSGFQSDKIRKISQE